MGVLTKTFVTAAMLAVAGPAFAADPYGVWVRPESGTIFDFYNCAGKLCAKVISVAKPEEKNAVGTVILRNAVHEEDGSWHGDLFNTDDGKVYSGSITVESSTQLTLEGCLVRYLCKSESWKRARDQSAASTPGGKPIMPAPSAKPGLGH